jgi:hypothetical protein
VILAFFSLLWMNELMDFSPPQPSWDRGFGKWRHMGYFVQIILHLV